jgi:phage terminase small subunit
MTQSKKPPKLSLKQEKFLSEYLRCGNATKAALNAGYSKESAGRQAGRLMKNDLIKKEIDKRKAEIAEKSKVKASDVINELRKIAFSDITNIANVEGDDVIFKTTTDLAQDVTATISSIEKNETKYGTTIKIRQWDKIKALQMLGEYFGILSGEGKDNGKDKTIPLKYNEKYLKEKINEPSN